MLKKSEAKIIEAGFSVFSANPTATLADVAKEADVPVSSIYHFYPSILDVYRSLAELFRDELAAFLAQELQDAMRQGEVQSWQALVEHLVEGTALFYRDNFEFQQLILSGKAPATVKQMDRDHDSALAELMSTAFQEYFEWPQIPGLNDVVFNAVEMVDLFFSLSVYRYQCVAPEGVQESKRAVLSYLRCYLPEYLMRKVN